MTRITLAKLEKKCFLRAKNQFFIFILVNNCTIVKYRDSSANRKPYQAESLRLSFHLVSYAGRKCKDKAYSLEKNSRLTFYPWVSLGLPIFIGTGFALPALW